MEVLYSQSAANVIMDKKTKPWRPVKKFSLRIERLRHWISIQHQILFRIVDRQQVVVVNLAPQNTRAVNGTENDMVKVENDILDKASLTGKNTNCPTKHAHVYSPTPTHPHPHPHPHQTGQWSCSYPPLRPLASCTTHKVPSSTSTGIMHHTQDTLLYVPLASCTTHKVPSSTSTGTMHHTQDTLLYVHWHHAPHTR